MPPKKKADQAQATAPAAEAECPDVSSKKKRNANPGVRLQGGRIYDSENGTTCHQCRQKTVEVKAKCTACTLYFCPRCLENRYQELVDKANATPGWRCPRCRGDCNCSNCRKRQGLEATGILAGVARAAGFGSVSDLLSKNPNARALHMARKASGDAAEGSAAGSSGAAKELPAKAKGEAGAKRKRAAPGEDELVPDAELGRRPVPMPDPAALAVHKRAAAACGPGVKRQRGPPWAASVPEEVPLPAGACAGQLAALLEFVHVFGGALGLKAPPQLACLAAELLQPPTGGRASLLCRVPEDSLVAQLHCRLLTAVREAWGVAGAVPLGGWQGIMRAYWAAAQLPGATAAELQAAHGPPAIAGELFTRPRAVDGAPEDEPAAPADADAGAGSPSERAPAAPELQYPSAAGYWGLAPGARLAMLHALCHDALDTYVLRQHVEAGLGSAAGEEKERRSELAEARRAAKSEAARQRAQEIAALVAGGSGGAMTLEQQRELLGAARARAEASAAAAAAAAKLRALSEAVHAPAVRTAPLGADREGRRYYVPHAAAALTGGGGVLVQAAADGGAEAWGHYPDALPVALALDARGRGEGPLRHALASACGLKPAALEAAAEAAAAPGSGKKKGQRGSAGTAKQPAAREQPAGQASTKARAQKQRARPGAEPAAEPAKAEPAAKAKAKAGRKSASPKGSEAAATRAAAAATAADAGKEAAGRRRCRKAGLPLKLDDVLRAR